MTEIVKASTDAELLALVPRLAGYTASNSIVCVAFNGNRTAGVFRIDLPAKRQLAAFRPASKWIVGALDRMPGVDGVAIVIYTDSRFDREKGIPWLDLERHLTDRVHREGFIIKAAFCVAQDGWASYHDRDYPREGRPLEEIEPSEPVPPIEGAARLPETTPAERHAFLEELVDVCAGYWPDALGGLAEATPIEMIEAILGQSQSLPLTLSAELVRLSQSPARRDVITMQVAFGDIVANAIEEQNAHYLDIQARTGGTMDDIVQREIKAGRAALDDEFSGLLLGLGRFRPDVDRVRSMIAILARAIALAPEHYRPDPLCILAWLHWSLGMSSAAGAFVDLALEIEPEHGMARLLHVIVGAGRVPEWAFGG